MQTLVIKETWIYLCSIHGDNLGLRLLFDDLDLVVALRWYQQKITSGNYDPVDKQDLLLSFG